jgi:DNA-binding NtrC family response regulator
MTASILVVDDEPAIQDILTWALSAEGYRVATAGNGEEALARVEEEEFDIIVTDIVMPGIDGLEVLERSRVLNPRAAVIVMTAYAALETAIAALREAPATISRSVLGRPPEGGSSACSVSRNDLEGPARPARDAAARGRALAGRRAMRSARSAADQPCGPHASNVLITGESGVGEAGRACRPRRRLRHDAAFVAINCGAIPGPAREPAVRPPARRVRRRCRRIRLFVAASQGTMFLDEIGEMPRRCRSAPARHRGQVRPAGRQDQGRAGGHAHHRQHEPSSRA